MRRLKPNDGKADRATGSARLSLPPSLPRQPQRPPQAGIPADKAVRERVRELAQARIAQAGLVPPLSMEELLREGAWVCEQAGIGAGCAGYAAIAVNNAAWRDTVARIPFERRLLLLPQCLRDQEQCPAPIDEFGLVCQACGRCSITHLQAEAESLGYSVLVAEGSTVVTKMIETGQIEAIVGVSCLSVLEKCFPHMEARAVPGLAIPLLQDGCANTSVDLDWVRDALNLTSKDRTYRLDLEGLRREAQSWFTVESLCEIVGDENGETERIAREWLARAGKRWRPYLTACVYLSLNSDTAEAAPPLSDDLKKLVLAVECFHKASLIHDDIEDGDEQRYGQPALHIEYGMPVALNVGDFLLGEGYRLIGQLEVDDRTKVRMLQIAAAGHSALSRGQGAELCWAHAPAALSSMEVLDIFRLKTAPAFEVALRLGAARGGADEDIHQVLTQYSEALGIAYQIRDDLEDYTGRSDSDDLRALRPSLILAIAHKRAADEPGRKVTEALWTRSVEYEAVAERLRELIARLGVVETAESLLEAYAAQAARCLHRLKNPTLKGLLRRVIGKIFGSDQIRDYCREFETRNAAGRAVGQKPVA